MSRPIELDIGPRSYAGSSEFRTKHPAAEHQIDTAMQAVGENLAIHTTRSADQRRFRERILQSIE